MNWTLADEVGLYKFLPQILDDEIDQEVLGLFLKFHPIIVFDI